MSALAVITGLGLILLAFLSSRSRDVLVAELPQLMPLHRVLAAALGIAGIAGGAIISYPLLRIEMAERAAAADRAPRVRDLTACSAAVFDTLGANRELASLAELSGLPESVPAGGRVAMAVSLPEEAELGRFSCLRILVCEVKGELLCATKRHWLEPMAQHETQVALELGDDYAAGQYRVHITLLEAEHEMQLVPFADGKYLIEDPVHHRFQQSFEVR